MHVIFFLVLAIVFSAENERVLGEETLNSDQENIHVSKITSVDAYTEEQITDGEINKNEGIGTDLNPPMANPACPLIITTNTYLDGDKIDCAGDSVVINANNIFLDCNGFMIRGGKTGIGIKILGNNTILRFCKIINFDVGVEIRGNDNKIIYNEIDTNDLTGVKESGYANTTIAYNQITGNANGINLHGGRYSSVHNNFIFNSSQAGIWMDTTPQIPVIVWNNISKNYRGIYLENSIHTGVLFFMYANRIFNNSIGLEIESGVNGNKLYNNYFENDINVNAVGGFPDEWNRNPVEGTNIIGGNLIGGNYWSDYFGDDNNDDGIGDTNLPYRGGNDIHHGDYYPLVYARKCADIPQGLVSFWPGDSDEEDILGGNEAELVNGASFSSGKVLQSLSFDGIDDYVDVPYSSNLAIANEMTFETWIKVNAQKPTYQTIIDNLGSSSNGMLTLVRPDSNALAVYVSENSEHEVANFFSFGQWVHLAVTTKAGITKVYKNGAIVSTFSDAVLAPTTVGTKFGARITGQSEFLNGSMDEIAIYNRELSESEILGIYRVSSKGKCKTGVHQLSYNFVAVAQYDSDTSAPLEDLCNISSFGNVKETHYDKFIANLSQKCEGKIISVREMSITFNGTTSKGNPGSDIFITNKSAPFYAWIVSQPVFELHASGKLAEEVDHHYNYTITASGTRSPPQEFEYKITALGTEKYKNTINIPFIDVKTKKGTLIKKCDTDDEEHYYSRIESPSPYKFKSYRQVSVDTLGDSKILEETFTENFLSLHLRICNRGWWLRGEVRSVYEVEAEGILDRDWSRTQVGHGGFVKNGEENKFIAKYIKGNSTGLPNILPQTITLKKYTTESTNQNVELQMNNDENALYAITFYKEEWFNYSRNESKINISEKIKNITKFNVSAPDNNTRFSVEIMVKCQRCKSPAVYSDLNGDGIVEAGQIIAWMDGFDDAKGPVGDTLYAAIMGSPPIAHIDNLTSNISYLPSNLSFFEGNVTFIGHGLPNNITGYFWRSHRDGKFGVLSQVITNLLSPANPHHIFFNARHKNGLWSPDSDNSTGKLFVNKPPTAFIRYVKGSMDNTGQIIALVGDAIELNGYGFDTDGVVDNYRWEFDGVVIGNNDVVNYPLGNTAVGYHTITFSVRDNLGVWSKKISKEILVLRHPVLLIHDYLRSPSEMSGMKSHLADLDYNVYDIDLRKPVDFGKQISIPLKDDRLEVLVYLYVVLDQVRILQKDIKQLQALTNSTSDILEARDVLRQTVHDLRETLQLISFKIPDQSGTLAVINKIILELNKIEEKLNSNDLEKINEIYQILNDPNYFENLWKELIESYKVHIHVELSKEQKIQDIIIPVPVPDKAKPVLQLLLESGEIEIPGHVELFSKQLSYTKGDITASTEFSLVVKDIKPIFDSDGVKLSAGLYISEIAFDLDPPFVSMPKEVKFLRADIEGEDGVFGGSVDVSFLLPSFRVDALEGESEGAEGEEDEEDGGIAPMEILPKKGQGEGEDSIQDEYRVTEKTLGELNDGEKVDVIFYFDEKITSDKDEFAVRVNELISKMPHGSYEDFAKLDFSDGFFIRADREALGVLVGEENIDRVTKLIPFTTLLSESKPMVFPSADPACKQNGCSVIDQSASEVAVCVIDTGVDYKNPVFGDCPTIGAPGCRIVGGFDFCRTQNCGFTASHYDFDPMDEEGHGTHVAGIIASGNSVYQGISSANIVAVKVSNNKTKSNHAKIANAINWCIRERDTYNIQVISISMGISEIPKTKGCEINEDIAPMIKLANEKGMVIVSAVGNEWLKDRILYPSCDPLVIGVGATTKDASKKIARYSNIAPELDILAPGGDWNTVRRNKPFEEIVSASSPNVAKSDELCKTKRGEECIDDKLTVDNNFIRGVGTSMAAPHVSGCAAILKGIAPSLTPKEITDILISSNAKINDWKHTQLHYPFLNCKEAICKAKSKIKSQDEREYLSLTQVQNSRKTDSLLYSKNSEENGATIDETLDCSMFPSENRSSGLRPKKAADRQNKKRGGMVGWPILKIKIAVNSNIINLKLANQDLKASAGELGKKIDEIRAETGIQKVDLVGSGMGGVIAQYYTNYGYRDDVRKVVLIGSPLHGSDLLELGPRLAKLLIDSLASQVPLLGNILGEFAKTLLDIILGDAIKQMEPHSSFLSAMNQNGKDTAPEWVLYQWSGGDDFINKKVQHYSITGEGPDLGITLPLTVNHVHAEIPLLGEIVSQYFVWWGDLLVNTISSSIDNLPQSQQQIITGLDSYHWWLADNDDTIQTVANFLDDAFLPPEIAPGIYSGSNKQNAQKMGGVYLNLTSLLNNVAVQSVGPFNGTINSSQNSSVKIGLDEFSFNATFMLEYRPYDVTFDRTYDTYARCINNLSLRLSSPLEAISPPNINGINSKYLSAPGMQIYLIEKPQAGNWTFNVSVINMTCPFAQFNVHANYKTNLTLGVTVGNTSHFEPGDNVTIRAYLRHAGMPISKANVTAQIMRASLFSLNSTPSYDTIQLFDDGKHNDRNANDGFYAANYSNTTVQDVYFVNVFALINKSSLNMSHQKVLRSTGMSFFVEALPELLVNSSQISISPQNPVHGGLINISANITNIGKVNATNAQIEFRANGTTIGFDVLNITKQSKKIAKVTWTAEFGRQEIKVIISPFNGFQEKNYSNNNASRVIFVSDSEPPIADSGPDQKARIGSLPSGFGNPIFLDASLSSDNDKIVSYRWDTDFGKPGNTILISKYPYVQFSGYAALGIHTAKLTVTDAAGNIAADLLNITVVDEYDVEAPHASAGMPQNVLVARPVEFLSLWSDDNFGIASYSWDIDISRDSDGDSIPDNDVDLISRNPILERGYPVEGYYTAKLTVDDVAGNGPVSDYVTITVVDPTPPECLADRDCDSIFNEDDNCPDKFNPEQDDYDEDGIGDACWCTRMVAGNGDIPREIEFTEAGDVLCMTSSSGQQIEITKSGITFDCLGNSIEGGGASDEIGIRIVQDVSAVVVQNCKVSRQGTGIKVEGYGNSVRRNTVEKNVYGFNVSGGGGILSRNKICSNYGGDIIRPSGNYIGSKNTCNLTQNWNDFRQEGCTLACKPCIEPTDGMQITKNTFLCKGEYYLPNGINYAKDNITLICDGTEIIGNLAQMIRAVSIDNFDYGILEGCTIKNYTFGIYASHTTGTELVDNILQMNKNAIEAVDFSSGNIENNFISYNSGYGISATQMVYTNVTGNRVFSSKNASANWTYSGNNVISRNMFTDGIYIQGVGSNSNQILSNEILNINGLIALRLGPGTHSTKVFSNKITGSGKYAVYVADNRNIFLANEISNSPVGFYLNRTNSTNITRNKIIGASTGIYGTMTNFSTFEELEISKSRSEDSDVSVGIELNLSIRNKISFGKIGRISLVQNSNNNTISNTTALIEIRRSGYNFIYGNNASAFRGEFGEEYFGAGISIFENSISNIIDGNKVSGHEVGIIFLNYSTGNIIRHNKVQGNTIGIFLENSSSNIIFNNYFANRQNANDSSGANTWNLVKQVGQNIVGGPYWGGNYWDDYGGADTDGDYLGNTNVPHKSSGGIIYGGDNLPLIGPVIVEIDISDRWNLLSLGADVSDKNKTSVFPTAVSDAFMFNNSYFDTTALEIGKGYWLKFSGPQKAYSVGWPIRQKTITLSEGWNMIGTISYPIDTSAIVQNPSGIVSSEYFGYNSGYQSTKTLMPGKGYWVKAKQQGSLTLTGSLPPVSSPLSDTLDLSGLNSILIRDADSNSQKLYFGKSGVQSPPQKVGLVELPPKISGIFDARYKDNSFAQIFQAKNLTNASAANSTNETLQYEILLASESYPITLEWSIKQMDYVYSLSFVTGSGPQNISLSGAGYTVISDANVDRLKLTANLVKYTLSVSRQGTGGGTVTASGINCGYDCNEVYGSSSITTLTASALAGSRFAGWSGACTGTGSCTLTMDSNKAVTAVFNKVTFSKLTATK